MEAPDTERLYISMLCESLAVNTDYIIEQSRTGRLPLWVELVNVMVVRLSIKEDDPANVKRIAKYNYTSVEHAENGIEVKLDRSMITQFAGNSRVEIRDITGSDRDGGPVVVWTISRFLPFLMRAIERDKWGDAEKHFTHDGNYDTEVVRLCIEKLKREDENKIKYVADYDSSKINSKISISTASLYAQRGDVEAFKKEFLDTCENPPKHVELQQQVVIRQKLTKVERDAMHEKQKELVEKLKDKEKSYGQIALELIKSFEEITNHRLGVLIDPFPEVTASGFKKRGDKYRKQAERIHKKLPNQ